MRTEIHAKGASFIATATEHNPRDLVIELVKQQPDSDRKTLFEQFRAELEDAGDEYRRAVEWYFFVNMYDYLVTSRSQRRAPDPVQRAEARVQQRERVEAYKAQIVMLDLTMPNGKQMRACTGQEMATFGNRFQKIAERVGRNKFVGSVLTENDVQAIMKRR
jgi:hypothetical protein